jgi:superfamily II DNA or RNA helicase
MSENFALCLIENSLWGYILQPVLVRETEFDSVVIQEIIKRESSCYSSLNDDQKAIISHYERYTEKTLMKNFSKEKHLIDFREKISHERIEQFIRPVIESSHRKIIDIVRKTDIPIYIRDSIKTRNLRISSRIMVSKSDADVIFNFQKEKDSGDLIYFIQVKSSENEVIDLRSRFFATICNEPAIVVLDDRLFVFNDIDAKKLQPFITKDNIRVRAASYRTYLEKFVVNCVMKYEVHSVGLSIDEIVPVKRPILKLVYDLHMEPVLNLSFRYESKTFYLTDLSRQKIVMIEERDDDVIIRWFQRNRSWENSIVEQLLSKGLKQRDVNNFYLESSPDADATDRLENMLQWISSNAGLIGEFTFSQSLSKAPYYIGKFETIMQIGEKQDWFDVNCIVVFDNFQLPFSNFRNHILSGIREYTLPDKRVIILPEEWFSSFQDIMYYGTKTDNSIRLDRRHFRLLDKNYPAIRRMNEYADIRVPKGIQTSLYNYQRKGFSWLVHLYKNGFGGCLADDMGLGKTLQTIALLQYIAEEQDSDNAVGEQAKQHTLSVQLSAFDQIDTPKHIPKRAVSLIVVPTSLLFNWQNELTRFAPSLRVYPYAGKNRTKYRDITGVFDYYDVVITTYIILRNDIEMLSGYGFYYLILDESQYVKNPDSQTYKAVKQINSRYKLTLTGTPVENSLTDLWAQFNIINNGMLGTQSSFKQRYINPIKRENEEMEKALLHMIQPFMLRRTKNEVAPELPPISEEVIYCDMSDEQAEFYETEKSKIRNSLISDDVMLHPQKISLIALKGLTRLRMIANHPQLVEQEYTSNSGKFDQVIMYIEGLIAERHKVLVFSSFVKHLKLFSEYFDAHQYKYAWLTGATINRENEINRFIQNDDIYCFFISLKAGGVGLNLTAADYVFILDPWWNPAAEMQAISRSHRIGQNKNVMVYRFISTRTIEEKIRHLQENKTKLADKFVASANPLNNMSKEDIEELLDE